MVSEYSNLCHVTHKYENIWMDELLQTSDNETEAEKEVDGGPNKPPRSRVHRHRYSAEEPGGAKGPALSA